MKASYCCFLCLLLILVAVCTSTGGQNYTSVAALFEIGVGARPAGLGNAFVGLADDETAAFHNPAGLAFADRMAINSYFSWQFSSFTALSVCLGAPYFGVTILQLDSGRIEAVDEDGIPIGEFHYVSRGGVFSAGFAPLEFLALGAKIKLFQSSSYSTNGLGGSLSPGLLFQMSGFRFGVSFENLVATPVYFSDGHIEPWPPDVRIGGAFSIASFSGSLEVENIIPRRGVTGLPHAHVGLEASFVPVAFRLGFDQNMLTLGMSINWNLVRLDYTTAIHLQLPMTHRLALTVFF